MSNENRLLGIIILPCKVGGGGGGKYPPPPGWATVYGTVGVIYLLKPGEGT